MPTPRPQAPSTGAPGQIAAEADERRRLPSCRSRSSSPRRAVTTRGGDPGRTRRRARDDRRSIVRAAGPKPRGRPPGQSSQCGPPPAIIALLQFARRPSPTNYATVRLTTGRTHDKSSACSLVAATGPGVLDPSADSGAPVRRHASVSAARRSRVSGSKGGTGLLRGCLAGLSSSFLRSRTSERKGPSNSRPTPTLLRLAIAGAPASFGARAHYGRMAERQGSGVLTRGRA